MFEIEYKISVQNHENQLIPFQISLELREVIKITQEKLETFGLDFGDEIKTSDGVKPKEYNIQERWDRLREISNFAFEILKPNSTACYSAESDYHFVRLHSANDFFGFYIGGNVHGITDYYEGPAKKLRPLSIKIRYHGEEVFEEDHGSIKKYVPGEWEDKMLRMSKNPERVIEAHNNVRELGRECLGRLLEIERDIEKAKVLGLEEEIARLTEEHTKLYRKAPLDPVYRAARDTVSSWPWLRE